jgi:predicted phage baseplate assembly protein
MALPEPILDDLRFQKDLVDEAKRRIIRYCPEWTDYNVSDPGVTLIELFAWMTELITYRLNLVPEKNYLRFLDVLGVQLRPASSARVELMFRLSAAFPITPEESIVAIVPKSTEISTRSTDTEPEVIFTTDERLEIRGPKLAQVRKGDDFNRNYLPRLGLETFYAFGTPAPKEGDTFYLGFDEESDIRGNILQLSFLCEETQATGVRRSDPPLVWEYSAGDGRWEEAIPSTLPRERDTTGGLNNERGRLVLYLPLALKTDQVHGRNCYWVRCRLQQRRPEQGMYTESPRILAIEVTALGASVMATHAVPVINEYLGVSNGDPGQTFRLRNAPVLDLTGGETVEVEEWRDGELVFVPWTRVADFSKTERYDRHFTLDNATGEIAFGPAVRQRDGSVRSYGRVPEASRTIQFTRYRYGGGTAGNVPANRIQTIKTAIPYIDSVTNLSRAQGGLDAESVEEAKQRARREMRAQQRAVTAEDFENFALNASRLVGRAKCNAARAGTANGNSLPPGTVELLIVPAAFDAVAAGDYTKLQLEEALRRELTAYLDQYRLLTTTVRIREPNYVGVKVTAEIVANDYSQPAVVIERVKGRLKQFITPLALNATQPAVSESSAEDSARGGEKSPFTDELLGSQWQGWPLGRSLYLSELFSIIQRVPGVKHVRDVRMSQRTIVPSRERPPWATAEGAEAATTSAPDVAPVQERVLKVAEDALLCSLEHEVVAVDI